MRKHCRTSSFRAEASRAETKRSTEIAVTIQKQPSRDVGGATFTINRGKRVNNRLVIIRQKSRAYARAPRLLGYKFLVTPLPVQDLRNHPFVCCCKVDNNL